jgi:thiol-disulfide isomerase/thioredoxin
MQDDFNRYKKIVEESNIISKQMNKEVDSLRRAQKFKSAAMMTSALDSVMKVRTSRLKELIDKHSDDEFAAFIMLSNAAVKDKLEEKEVLYNLLSEKARQTPSGKNLLVIINRMRALGVGKIAPNFELTDITGNKVNLYGIRAKMKIIDFWASWCGPCRMENPNMVSLYKDFKSKGLEVISVSLDSSKEKWMQAVNKDRMTWAQVSSLKAWNCPVAQLYEVKQVPTIYVLDSYNNIIAKDIRGEELREFITKHINQ